MTAVTGTAPPIVTPPGVGGPPDMFHAMLSLMLSVLSAILPLMLTGLVLILVLRGLALLFRPLPTLAKTRQLNPPADDPDAGIVTYQAVLDLLPADVRDALTVPLPTKKGKRR